MKNGARMPKGSKTLATVERTVRSVDDVVLFSLVVGCTNIVSSVVSLCGRQYSRQVDDNMS